MNKKGLITFNIINFIPKIIFLAVVVLTIVFMVRGFVRTDVDISASESYVLVNRIIYSSIAYHDESINRTYPGIVDLIKFNSERIGSTIAAADNLGAKLDLVGRRMTAYYNKDFYEQYYPQRGIKGGSKEIKTKFYVLVRDGETSVPDTLEVSVISR